jgi:hypothetical protein
VLGNCCAGIDCGGVCNPNTPVGATYVSLQVDDEDLVDYGIITSTYFTIIKH